MANWSDLKAAVASIVKINGNKEITGQLMQNVLNNIISNVGLNSSFAGIAPPGTNPGTPDGNVFYIATTVGTYSNFNGIVINPGEAVILEWKGSWVKKDSGFATKEKLSELGSEVEVCVTDCISRASVIFSGKNHVNLGKGYIYIVYGGSSVYQFLNDKELSFEFTESSKLVLDKTSEQILIVSSNDDRKNKLVLLEYDKEIGFSGGLLFYKYLEKEIDESLQITFKNCLYDRNIGLVKSNLIACKVGDSFDVKVSPTLYPKNVFIELDANLLEIGRWTVDRERIITISNELTSYIYVLFDKSLEFEQNISDPSGNILAGVAPYLAKKDDIKEIHRRYTEDRFVVSRAPISINGNEITIGNGYMYIFPNAGIGATTINCVQTTYSLSSDSYLIYDLQNKEFVVLNYKDYDNETQVILFQYDNAVGVCNGKLWANTSIAEIKKKVDSIKLEDNVRFIGSVIVNKDGVVSVNGMLDAYYGRGGIFKRFGDKTELFTITSSGTSCVRFIIDGGVFSVGGNKSEGTVVGVTIGKELFLGESVEVTYINADGSENTQYNMKSMSDEIERLKNGNRDKAYLPNFVLAESLLTYNRVMNYLNEHSFLLAHITDVHSGNSERFYHIGYLNELNKSWGFNVLCNNGDIGLDVGETETEAMSLLYNVKSQMNCTSPWLFCKGNHERLVSMKKLGNIFMKPSQRQFPIIKFGTDNGLYGYIDNDESNVRTIYLNTSDADDGSGYNISIEQMTWLINTLNQSGERNVVILTHFCIHPIGAWKDSSGYTSDERIVTLRQILEDFANNQNGGNTDLNLSWDFSMVKAKLVCVLAGDSHFNNYIKDNGVNYIVRQGYGGVSDNNLPTENGATKDDFDSSTQCLFDVLVVNDNSNAKVFRIGAGGESRDLEITF